MPGRRDDDQDLYIERWLLELKVVCRSVGLRASVRAIGEKGGRRLALLIRDDAGAVEMRYHKRRRGVALLAAADDLRTVARAMDAHRRFIESHRRVLQNGLRRFGKRGLRALTALHERLVREPGVLDRVRARLPAADGDTELRPALVAVRLQTLRSRHELIDAAAIVRPARRSFAAFDEDGRLVDLSELLPPVRDEEADDRSAGRPKRPESDDGDEDALDRVDLALDAVELVADVALLATFEPAEVGGAIELAGGAADAAAGGAELAAGGVEAAGGALATAGEIAGGAFEVAGAVAGGVANVAGGAISFAGSAAEAAGGAAEAAGGVAEVAGTAGGCCGDAACAGVDCGGLACLA